ncbi:four helix bundle protein [Candidatus Falkowbacteria bacterium]|nr:four helix bundle protein [Candidatus Falkowbacteria bacterium]
MSKNIYQNDLKDRTFRFARDVRVLVKTLTSGMVNREDSRQVTRSSGSVAANYIEASEALSKKDEVYRIRICRKEAKESKLWLELLLVSNDASAINEISRLIDEADQLTKIFSSIIIKLENQLLQR